MESKTLQSLLRDVAHAFPDIGLIIYRSEPSSSTLGFSYRSLFDKSRRYAGALRESKGYRRRSPILIYLEDQLESLLWFWATLFADSIPVMVPRMSNIAEQRLEYTASLDALFGQPIWITSPSVQIEDHPDIGINILDLATISSRLDTLAPCGVEFEIEQVYSADADQDAIFMLTSGSTGTPKAARLNHHQLLTSIKGKLSMREHPVGMPFLNWISFDHVASIVEIHLTAMCHGVAQVLVKAIDVISDPLLLVRLLSEHQVSRTFAPNFFLAKLVQSTKSSVSAPDKNKFDLRHLMWLGSGGEANSVETGVALSAFLTQYGSRPDVLVPGFGMTETCAGAIYNMNCPDYDTEQGNSYTALGKCIPGIEMRIVPVSGSDESKVAASCTHGDLEVRGDVVLKGYYNNVLASQDAFTRDGWFRTGDQAMIDINGVLNLVGRAKDTAIINGVSFSLQEIENVVSRTLTFQVSRVVCFPFRSKSTPTESLCIIYVLNDGLFIQENVAASYDKIKLAIVMHTGAIPQVIALPDESTLPVSSLGKISRTKLRTLHEEGLFQMAIATQNTIVDHELSWKDQEDCGEDVSALLSDFHSILDFPLGTFGPDTTIFSVGMTSIDIFRLKHCLENRLWLQVPLTSILSNPTARSMAAALKLLRRKPAIEYDPVVALKQEGNRAPLWLVHPGVGEVLVFLGLSKRIMDRPVYALRARGFDGEPPFTSVTEAVVTYYGEVKKHQPRGPYAVAGYSYGSMLAFEVCKRLEANGDEVRFLGSFNLPPHIRYRMQQMNWKQCLIHLCYFLDLIPEELAEQITPDLQECSDDEAFKQILGCIDHDRLRALSLDQGSLKKWTHLSYGLQSMAVDYEPSGSVSRIDIFHAEPLKIAARSRAEWVEQHLTKWSDFTDSTPRLHEVRGAHYTMLAPEHVESFAEILQAALKERGI